MPGGGVRVPSLGALSFSARSFLVAFISCLGQGGFQTSSTDPGGCGGLGFTAWPPFLPFWVGLKSRGSMRSDGPGTGFAPREGPKSVRIPQHLGGSSVFYTMGFLERPLKSKGSNTLGDFFEDTPLLTGGACWGWGQLRFQWASLGCDGGSLGKKKISEGRVSKTHS